MYTKAQRPTLYVNSKHTTAYAQPFIEQNSLAVTFFVRDHITLLRTAKVLLGICTVLPKALLFAYCLCSISLVLAQTVLKKNKFCP